MIKYKKYNRKRRKKQMNKVKKWKLALGVVGITLSLQGFAFAATTWSNSATFSLSSDTGWNRRTTLGTYLANGKTTDSDKVTVYTVSKTMTSVPRFRMVNSSNEARSAVFSVPKVGKSKVSKSNTGEKGYTYYASVKEAWNQIADNQSIRIQFKSH